MIIKYMLSTKVVTLLRISDQIAVQDSMRFINIVIKYILWIELSIIPSVVITDYFIRKNRWQYLS